MAELTTWLTREDELRGLVSVEQSVARPGEMGGLADALVVAVGAQGTGTVLAASLAVWIKHRRPSADIEVSGPDGRNVKISIRDTTDGEVAALLRQALDD